MRTFSLTVAASAFGLLSVPWVGEAGAATAPVVLLDGGNPGCAQVLDDAEQIAINNPTGGSEPGPGGQMIDYSMNAERTMLESWTVVSGDPVTVVIVRNSGGGPGGPKVFEYLYNPPGVLEDEEFIAPGGGVISKITFCYGVEANGLGAGPEPQVSIEDLPCPDPTFEESVCQDDSVGNDIVAFFFDTTATIETDEHGNLATLPVGVCSCDGVGNGEGGNNNLTECSLDINDDDYCFKEDDFTFSNIQAFRGIDAFCTTNEEFGSTICSTFCVRGFPGGTSFSCGN